MKPLHAATGLLILVVHPSLQFQIVGSEGISLDNAGKWTAVSTSPNASSLVRVPGFDVTEPFPSTEGSWSLSVNLKAGIPLPLPAGDDEDDRDPGSYTTAVEVRFNAPGDVVRTNQTDPSWFVRQTWYISSRLRTDDDIAPNCASTLSEECRTAWTAMLVRGFRNGLSGPPEECRDEVLSGREDREDVDMLGGSMAFPLRLSPDGEGGLLRYAASNHSKDDTSAYDDMRRQVWIAGIAFGPSGEINATHHNFPEVRLACIRANETVGDQTSEWDEGDDEGDDEDDGAGTLRPGQGLGGTSAWAAMIVAAGFALAIV